MSSKIQRIAGLAVICLASATTASILTIILLGRGVLGSAWISSGSSTTSSGGMTAATTLTPTPTSKPTPTVTPSPTPTVPPASPTPDPSQGTGVLYWWQTHDLVEKLFENVSPSVVGIDVEVAASGTASRKTNEGSGIIYSRSGMIVTNAGILSIAIDKQGELLTNASIRVYVRGVSQTFTASLVARDSLSGLAVLRIDPGINILQPAVFSADPELKVGQVILALGYPDELYESGGLSSGIITGLDRPVMLEDGTNLRMIQTDALISKICSGGPLLNLAGEVIGLTNCALKSDATDTLSYALPADTVQMVAANLIKNGYIPGRSWLGISILLEDSFLDLQKLYKLPGGLYVSNVVKDSPAYTADLRKGDVITEINGEVVSPSMDMSYFLQTQPVGSLVTFRVYRRSDGKYHSLQAYLQEYRP
ncbi:MAG TPA: hypothetical protein DD640_08700 [Clostridiales bacterium]|nr:hypothetical protein [Clostridiales bacterium]